MYTLTISPDTYEIPGRVQGQNPFQKGIPLDHALAMKQHSNFRHLLPDSVHFTIKTSTSVPDLVFIASAGLSLPRLPEPVVILPSMKYTSRKAELPFIEKIFMMLNIKTYAFPKSLVFEGKAECIWIQEGKCLLHGFGYRSSFASTQALQGLLIKIYSEYGVEPPKVIPIHLQNPSTYHIDLAVMAYCDTECCIKAGAIDSSSVKQLKQNLDKVTIIQTSDYFALNNIVLKNKIIVHKLTDTKFKDTLSHLTKKKIVEVDVSEFEKSGGAVACLVMNIYDPRLNQTTFL